MRTSLVLAFFAVIAGCTSRQVISSEAARPLTLRVSLPEDDIAIAIENLQNQWTVQRTADFSGQQALEFELPENAAHVTVTAYLAVIDLRSLLLVSRDAFADEGGFIISPLEPLKDGDGARFTFSGPPRGSGGPTRGEVRAWEVPGSGHIVVFSGIWLASIDSRASVDFNAMARGVTAAAKK